MDQADAAVGAMELGAEVVQQDARGALQGGEIRPPAVVGELVLEVPPDPLDEIQLGAVSRQPQRADAVLMRNLPAACHVTLVIAYVVQHYQDPPRR